MKKMVLALFLVFAALSPTLAFAGSATDAALGLGAFAVFNQILSGTGIFGGFSAAPAVAAPVIVAPPPPVVVAPPPPPVVYYAPPQVYYAPPPRVIVAPPPTVYYAPTRVYRAPHRPVIARGWCKHGRCY